MTESNDPYQSLRDSNPRMDGEWFETGTEPGFITDRGGKLVAVNLAFCQRYGVGSTPLSFSDLVDLMTARVPDRELFRAFCYDNQRALAHTEFPMGEEALLIVTPYPSDSGEIMLAWGIVAEGSEPESDEPKGGDIGQFAGCIAHDFKNYLTTIIGNLSLVEVAINETERRNCIQDATEAALSASDMAKELMSLSGQMSLSLLPLDPDGFLHGVARKIRPTLPFNVELSVEIEEMIWPMAADRLHLERVFMNLCVNAMSAMHGGGTLRLVARNLPGATPEAEDRIELSVADEGDGMPPEICAKIFKPYFSTKGNGLAKSRGLGLFIAKSIVEGHGGQIICLSKVGVGTTFRVVLPRAKREAPAPKTAGQLGKILIVDDERVMRTLTSDLLSQVGYEILLAGSGEEALEMCERHRFELDLVMLDLKMPVLSGARVCRLMRERGMTVPIIVCTGFRDHALRFEEEAGELPAAMVMKPFDLESLLVTVSRVLGTDPPKP